MEHLYSCIICEAPLSAYEDRLHCGSCNLLFIHTHVTLSGEARLEEEPVPADDEARPYLRSPKSETYHIPPCKYSARIEDGVWITQEEASELRACGCVERNG